MEQENCELYKEESPLPKGCSWSDLRQLDGPELVGKYDQILTTLSQQDNILGVIYYKARNQIALPTHLRKLLDMLEEVDWLIIDVDVKGAIYESILSKNASAEKGAGQYFTPRPLIRAIVDVMRPTPTMSIHDPFCGTGGFLLAAHDYVKALNPNREQIVKLHSGGISGNDITPLVVSLCSMNMYLHGIIPSDLATQPKDSCPIQCKDTLREPVDRAYNMILANPPFSTAANSLNGGNGELSDDRYFVLTSNTQLNALQHIMAVLKPNIGRAAVVLPDNVLFDAPGESVRKRLLNQYNLHTILRLPTGLFYAQGVKANVIFFDCCPLDGKDHHTNHVWIYDYRTNIKHTLKQNPLKRSDLDDFVSCYSSDNLAQRKQTYSEDNPNGRWRRYSYEEIMANDKTSLDIKWIKEDSDTVEGSIPELMAMLQEELKKEQDAFAALSALLSDNSNLA